MRARARLARAVGPSDDEAWSDDELGAAVVDFVFISVLVLFLLFGVLQVAIYFYARNVAAASTADAARYAAADDVAPAAGAPRAERLIRSGLDDADARGIDCTSRAGRERRSGLPVVTVQCTGRLRLLFSPLLVPLDIDTSSTVLREGRR